MSEGYRIVKRLVDVGVSASLLAALAPALEALEVLVSREVESR
jgi:lipopolysaccharide/colanic/teichoic acid biosynthesis glycosyltransferase